MRRFSPGSGWLQFSRWWSVYRCDGSNCRRCSNAGLPIKPTQAPLLRRHDHTIHDPLWIVLRPLPLGHLPVSDWIYCR